MVTSYSIGVAMDHTGGLRAAATMVPQLTLIVSKPFLENFRFYDDSLHPEG
jgi:hypothetical protein